MGGDPAEVVDAVGGLEIEDGALLAGIEVEEEGGALRVFDGAAGSIAAGGVALGWFDLDDASTGVREQATAVGDGCARAEFDDGEFG